MRNALLTLLFVAALFTPAFAQTSLFEGLTAELSNAKTAADFESIVARAKNLHSKYKKEFGGESEKFAEASLEFGLFWAEMFESLNERRAIQSTSEENLALLMLYLEYRNELGKPFLETIEIYEEKLKVETLFLATAKYELVRLKEKYIVVTAASDWKMRLAFYSRNQELYLSAYNIREKLLDKNDESVLQSAFSLANSYVVSADFENALIYYERFINGYREKHGENSPDIVPALLVTAEIRKMADDRDAVERISKEIEQITKQPVVLSDNSLLLSPRATSFKHKGIDPKWAIARSQRAHGITNAGTVESLGRNDIRQRQVEGQSPFRVIYPGEFSYKLAKVYKVLVSVDAAGRVVSVNAEIEDSKTKKAIEKRVLGWKFQPFVYNRKPTAMNGFVYYYDT